MARAQIYNGRARIKDGKARVGPDDACCCEDAPPIPENCGGYMAYNWRSCFPDLLATYPANPGDNAALLAYISSIQWDVTLPGSWVNGPFDPCLGTDCPDLNGRTLTAPIQFPANPRWRFDQAPFCGISPGNMVLTIDISCSTVTDQCRIQVLLFIAKNNSSHVQFNWNKTYSSLPNLATFSDEIPNDVNHPGADPCAMSSSDPILLAIH